MRSKRQAAQQRRLVGLGCRPQAFLLEARHDERVDRRPHPRRGLHLRQRRADRCLVGPVIPAALEHGLRDLLGLGRLRRFRAGVGVDERHAGRIRRAGIDPGAQQPDLLRRQLDALLLRRHRDVLDEARYQLDQRALLAVPRQDDLVVLLAALQEPVARVEAEAALLPLLAVTADAGRLEERLDVLVEVVGRRGGRQLADVGGVEAGEREAGGRQHRGHGPQERGSDTRHGWFREGTASGNSTRRDACRARCVSSTMASCRTQHPQPASPAFRPTPRPRFEQRQVDAWRQLSPLQRLRLVSDTTRAVTELALAGIRQRYPQASERECFLRLAAIRLGVDTVRRIYSDAAKLTDLRGPS